VIVRRLLTVFCCLFGLVVVGVLVWAAAVDIHSDPMIFASVGLSSIWFAWTISYGLTRERKDPTPDTQRHPTAPPASSVPSPSLPSSATP
jgi:hypothetical protein